MRTDYCETKNVNIAAIQKFFRENDSDEYAGEKSFIAGSSTSNQVGYQHKQIIVHNLEIYSRKSKKLRKWKK